MQWWQSTNTGWEVNDIHYIGAWKCVPTNSWYAGHRDHVNQYQSIMWEIPARSPWHGGDRWSPRNVKSPSGWSWKYRYLMSFGICGCHFKYAIYIPVSVIGIWWISLRWSKYANNLASLMLRLYYFTYWLASFRHYAISGTIKLDSRTLCVPSPGLSPCHCWL